MAILSEYFTKIVGGESKMTKNSVKLLFETWPLCNEKAKRELGWQPRPVEESIAEAALYFKNTSTKLR